MKKNEEKLKEIAEALGYKYETLKELLERKNNDSDSYTDEEKRMLGDVSLLKLFLEIDTTAAVIFLDIINALTGLDMEEAHDLVQYISKAIQDADEYGKLIVKITEKQKASMIIDNIMSLFDGLK